MLEARAGEAKRRAARDAVKRLSPEHRQAYTVSGYSPGDAYIGIWDAVMDIRHAQGATNEKLTSDDLGANARASTERRADYLREQLISTFATILPYERPKLAVIQFKGDHDSQGPIIDLKKLPDVRLKQLEEITLLLTGGTPGHVESETGDVSHRVAAPPGREGDAKGRKKLRRVTRGSDRP
jgi:hypothetical protein